MQHYFFDIHWNDETVLDDEGTGHFDDGSALYYGRTLAIRIARCGKGESVRVHVRDDQGRLLSIVTPGSWRPEAPSQVRTRAIIERDRTRQSMMSG
ncbi:hypothetical protein JJB09_23645 [Rhizobium sp. KVB221]|uniref:DUF6894 domain-containing protein n=1 Tax=Rhizobium setariae TaxID=2801340 RepID=A0A936YQU3_9HYPH|nr:hypothetical protein [Rhizobium setariae]MBL0375013.1 hypothetical protein [Rhizobium setariae]